MAANTPGAALRRKSLQRGIGMIMLLCMIGLFAASPLFTNSFVAHAASSVQINAGGSAAAPFIADADFTGGTTAGTTHAIDTSGVSNPAPLAVYQSNRYGNFTYTIPGLTANGSYTVRLHFAEEFWTAAGKRVFNASINSTQVLTNFDIFATAGAEFKAVVQQFNATASSSGTITIQFTTVTDNAQVNGIEVLGSSSSTPTPTPAPGTGSVQINAGGPAVAPFIADADFTGGTTAGTTHAIDTSGVSNPAPQAVYQSNRFGNFTYTIPGLTANGSYTVRLHFAEEFWTAAGKRVFNASINSTQVLTNFDIFASAGAEFKAVVEQFSATANGSGTITIQFTTVTDNAQVNGIEVLASGSSTPTPTPTSTPTPTPTPTSGPPNFGPNVFIFTPSMAQSQIQSTVNSIANQQLSNQFGTQRYALLFEPGTYGSSGNPLRFQVGYYTSVAGLGRSPTDVVINGSIDVYNQCLSSTNCIALVNFWRSLSNLTINVNTPNAGCYNADFWAVSQAAPMRRVEINGAMTLQDFCTQPNYASGGFIADSKITGSNITSGSQQQFVVRNSQITGWSNGVWNQVFSGVVGAPGQCFPAASSCGGPYTTLPSSPVTREEPYLYTDASGNDNVFVPSVQTHSSGTSWANGATPGTSLPISTFFIAQPSDSAATINSALGSGKNLILTPGVYNLSQSINVTKSDTVVLGLGFATLIPQNGIVSMQVANAPGIMISGILFDAGTTTSPVLLQVGSSAMHNNQYASDPPTLHDVFFRIGGATAGSATTSLIVNSANVILDDIWAWRADHGNGVGWTSNTANTGVVVNGDNVTAYGLFVEHYQQYEVIWNGNGGTDIFFQNEMPYDPPSQAAWMEAPGVNGWAAFKIASTVTSFSGYGMGSYSFFNQGVSIFAANAFEVPTTLPAGSLHDLLTIFLSTSGSGGIQNVINGVGGSSTSANPDKPVTVVSYP
ncbi:MAG TPA: malectin domain-containing carbohydrate-binding protein [Ktedonosporobacter sp.]|nr:malectin domain-containing carbohydrate-binding protein [Ktedonosporobacter sp.]